uniref:NAD(P)(+)--arginine ADP-ribosyltransferase n=1 Tax=Haptolina brevifila TaxID=156173 RepID=A0A7S2D7J1_9EUKA|mmetsp:Transcript_34032/g.67779  ORF Transcript_34032/g.67779 Transcript_34032/m.67779 type:complete len:278 (+) Transcript_34032:1605-2438(+)
MWRCRDSGKDAKGTRHPGPHPSPSLPHPLRTSFPYPSSTQPKQECLEYVLHQRAGSSSLLFPNSPYPRDCDAGGTRTDRKAADGLGCVLADFVYSKEARQAELTTAHVLALRLYSTAAFKALNAPLRNFERTEAHPLAATVCVLAEGIKKLRALDTENRPVDLWRGMRNLSASDTFEESGGTEFAVMSTTLDPVVAVKYAMGASSLLFKLRTDSFMDRGADIAFLSAFPSEREYVFPPLTYLKPTGRTETIQIDVGEAANGSPKTALTVIEVQPHVV